MVQQQAQVADLLRTVETTQPETPPAPHPTSRGQVGAKGAQPNMADPTEVEESEHEVQPPAKNWRKELEDQAKQARAEADEAKRELAFTRAGLTDLSDKQVRALLATHEGEITADAIKATANELGFVKPASEAAEVVDPEQEQRTEELGHLNRFAGAPAAETAAAPADAVLKGIEEFDGDFQQFQEYIMANASSVLPPRA